MPQARDYVCWGLEQRHQNGSDLLLTTPDLTVSGFAGTSTTRAGSVSTNIFRGTLTTSPVAVCGTGSQPHIGVYRVFARYWASGTGVRLRFTYRDGDGSLTPLLYATPPAEDAWCETDLGVITVSPKLLGTQRWQGQVEAYSGTPGDTLDIDYLALIPAGEGFGRARRPSGFETPTAFSARSEFGTESGPITGDSAAAGGPWVGAGDADDFSASGGVATRTVVSDSHGDTGGRFVTLDVNHTATAVQADVKTSAAGEPRLGVLARYADVNNWLKAQIRMFTSSDLSLYVQKRVAGTLTTIAAISLDESFGLVPAFNTYFGVRLQVEATGRWFVWVWPTGSLPVRVAAGFDAVLATGGALASGDVGLYDSQFDTAAITRTYANFSAFVPASDAVIHAGQSLEIRHDETIREDSTGTYWGPPAEYRGSPFFVPPAGDENRTSRVVVMVRRHDLESMPSEGVTDTQSIQVFWRPRFLVIPR